MDSSVNQQTKTQRTPQSVAPVDSASFVDTVLEVAHERASETIEGRESKSSSADVAPDVVIDLTDDLTESDSEQPAGRADRAPVSPKQFVRRSRIDRRQSANVGRHQGRERRQRERRAARDRHPAVQVVDFVPQVVPPQRRTVGLSRLRRARHAWREWRISRAPRHRHTLGQRLQYRWWRRQDRKRRRQAQGLGPRFDVLTAFLRGFAVVAFVVVAVYVVMAVT